MTPEEIKQEKEMVALKSQADEKAGEDGMDVIFEDAGPRTLFIDISEGLMTCTWEDWSNNAYKRIDLSYIDTLAVRHLLNCEDNAAMFEEMKKRFASADGINQIDSWLTENEVYFKREEE